MDPFEPTPSEAYKKPVNPKFTGDSEPEPARTPRREYNEPARKSGRGSNKKTVILSIVAVIILAGLIFMGKIVYDKVSEANAKQLEIEQLQLANEQLSLQNEYAALDNEFQGYENQMRAITDDSVKRALTEKYNAAKLRVEQLIAELNSEKAKSAQQIKALKDEIDTLRALLRHYVEQIDRLSKENESLRNENAQVRDENARLSNQVAETSRANERLTERMTLAEKLNITGLSLQALNSKGKTEKKVQKAKQLVVSFTIPQNNSTPVGEKTIFVRITSPAGNLLGDAGTFPFEGANVPYTARKVIEYTGEELSGVTIYWDVNTALSGGEYTVEVFADNYRLASRSFTLK